MDFLEIGAHTPPQFRLHPVEIFPLSYEYRPSAIGIAVVFGVGRGVRQIVIRADEARPCFLDVFENLNARLLYWVCGGKHKKERQGIAQMESNAHYAFRTSMMHAWRHAATWRT